MMSSSAGNIIPGGPAHLGQGPDLPMAERTTDLQAWRAANEEKAARRRGGVLLAQVAAREAPAPAAAESMPSDIPGAGVTLSAPVADIPSAPPVEPAPAVPLPAPTEPGEPTPSKEPASKQASEQPRARRAYRPHRHVDVKGICEAYVAGASPPQIAQRFGITPATVRRALRAAGVHLRDDRGGGRHVGRGRAVVSSQEEQAIVAAYTAGSSIRDVARETGRHPRTVRRVLDAHGVTVRPPMHLRASQPVAEPEAPQVTATAPSAAVVRWARSGLEEEASAEVRNNWFQGGSALPEPVVDARRVPDLAQELVALANDLAAFVGRIRRVAALVEEGKAS